MKKPFTFQLSATKFPSSGAQYAYRAQGVLREVGSPFTIIVPERRRSTPLKGTGSAARSGITIHHHRPRAQRVGSPFNKQKKRLPLRAASILPLTGQYLMPKDRNVIGEIGVKGPKVGLTGAGFPWIINQHDPLDATGLIGKPIGYGKQEAKIFLIGIITG